MPPKLKPLSDQVMVITGASSGIGRSTALAAARRGAKLVLTARDAEVLRSTEADIHRHRGTVHTITGDVASLSDVEAVADLALRTWGRIDTWVNNAGVALFGTIERTPEADARRLFETNVWGVVHGSKVAVRHLKASGGAIVTVGSVASDFGIPLQGFYCASKHAVKGFLDTLRMELEAEEAPVSVTLIKPASVATPIVDNLANHTGRRPKLPAPLYAPADVAEAILHAAAFPERDIYVGGAGRLMSMVAAGAPHLADRIAARFATEQELGEAQPDRTGNLREPSKTTATLGSQAEGRPSFYTRATLGTALPRSAAQAAGDALIDAAFSLFAPRSR